MKLEDEIKTSSFKTESEKLIVNIIYTGNWLNYHYAKKLKEYGISLQQYNILRILRGQYPNPATVNLLKDRMLDKMSNASRLVEKLRLKGLIERRICEHDRRAVDVIITKKGLDLLSELDVTMDAWAKRFKNLSAEEIKTFNKLLDKFRE
ncbi:MAG: MarR family transcriptional regulator [Calditrichaeota bacterium]|nr:MarR family transcriptional regulator [Calditrichota bacterium]